MADHRYGNRSNSIFSDDDRDDRWRGGRSDRWRREESGWGGSYARGREEGGRWNRGAEDERGFFERAGDEVRSWFGDEEAERRREQDARRDEQERGMSGPYRGGGHEDQWTGRAPERSGGSWNDERRYERSRMRSNYGASSGYSQDDYSRGGYGDGGFGAYGASGRSQGSYGQGMQGSGQGNYNDPSYGQTSSSFRSGSPHDESYRRWREQQIEALDREYDEYCRHRQQQFEQDFSSFRQNRQGGITSGGATMSQGGQMGSSELSSRSGATAGMGSTTGQQRDQSGTSGQQNAGATTTGSGNASAATSSTGSSGSASSSGEMAGAGSGRSSSRSRTR